MFKYFNAERLGKIFLYALADVVFICASFAIAISLWYVGLIPGSGNASVPTVAWIWYFHIIIVAMPLCVIVFAIFRLYNNLWKYANIEEIFKIFLATIIVFFMLFIYDSMFISHINLMALPKRMIFIAWLLDFVFVIFSRFGLRLINRFFITVGHVMASKAGCKRIMIVGAGYAGYGIVRSMLNNKIRSAIPVAVIDADQGKNNTMLLGVRVFSGFDKIEELAVKLEIDEIIIALPDENPKLLNSIADNCTKTGCTIKYMPPIKELNESHKEQLPRALDILDLLPREEVCMDTKKISEYIYEKVVLVTGGGGSIGSELCRQIIKFSPAKLVIFDIYENNAYDLQNDLKAKYGNNIKLEIKIGSVQDINVLDDVFKEYNPNVVFHAAAHKHVPLMEENIKESVKNNVFGTYNVAQASNKYGVEKFVMISTDKAVNPTSVMGSTKRIAELMLWKLSQESKTNFMVVRFGNVLGSNGSIIPLFNKQIERGGPVTVTHPDIIRYFMTIPEASQLVLQAAGLGKSGKLFVLNMGEQVKIDDFARKLIKLSGYVPDRDIEVVYTGLRPGEKLYEELMSPEEEKVMRTTEHEKIFVTELNTVDISNLMAKLEKLNESTNGADDEILKCIKEIVPNFKHGGDICV